VVAVAVIFQLNAHHLAGPTSRARNWLAAGSIAFSIAAVGATAALTTADAPEHAGTSPSGAAGAVGAATNAPETHNSSQVIKKIESYRLVPADEPTIENFCPTRDKIDLDSGQPGYGGQVQLGDHLETCRTEGGLPS
jgi:hypothetical protein